MECCSPIWIQFSASVAKWLHRSDEFTRQSVVTGRHTIVGRRLSEITVAVNLPATRGERKSAVLRLLAPNFWRPTYGPLPAPYRCSPSERQTRHGRPEPS